MADRDFIARQGMIVQGSNGVSIPNGSLNVMAGGAVVNSLGLHVGGSTRVNTTAFIIGSTYLNGSVLQVAGAASLSGSQLTIGGTVVTGAIAQVGSGAYMNSSALVIGSSVLNGSQLQVAGGAVLSGTQLTIGSTTINGGLVQAGGGAFMNSTFFYVGGSTYLNQAILAIGGQQIANSTALNATYAYSTYCLPSQYIQVGGAAYLTSTQLNLGPTYFNSGIISINNGAFVNTTHFYVSGSYLSSQYMQVGGGAYMNSTALVVGSSYFNATQLQMAGGSVLSSVQLTIGSSYLNGSAVSSPVGAFTSLSGSSLSYSSGTIGSVSLSTNITVGSFLANSTYSYVGNGTVFSAANSTYLQVYQSGVSVAYMNSTAFAVGSTVVGGSSITIGGQAVPVMSQRTPVYVNGSGIATYDGVNIAQGGSGLVTVSGSTPGSTYTTATIDVVYAAYNHVWAMTGGRLFETGHMTAALSYQDKGATGASFTPDFSTFLNAQYQLNSSTTIGFPSIPSSIVGRSGVIDFYQDGTGGRTITWSAGYKFDQGAAPTIDTAANRHNGIAYHIRSTSEIWISLFAAGAR